MKMREHLQKLYKVLTQDETLLRLLYYKVENAGQSPLDPAKPNILSRSDKWTIIDDVIKTAEVVTDLESGTTEKCRVLMYAGRRMSTGNYLVSEQDFVFDVLVHSATFDQTDQRLSWICDHLNSLLIDKNLVGVSKIQFKSGGNIPTPNGYSGYRLIYQFGSVNI
jgi:hypothetical protein